MHASFFPPSMVTTPVKISYLFLYYLALQIKQEITKIKLKYYFKRGGQVISGCPRTDKGASPLVPSCTVHALFQPDQHIVFLFLAILGHPNLSFLLDYCPLANMDCNVSGH
jgi:hypothetical protein